MSDRSSKRDREPQGDIPVKPFVVGMAALAVAGAIGVNRIHDYAESHPPETSLEEVQHNLGVEPKSAEVPAGTAKMPAAQIPEIDLANTVVVQPPVEK